jgi:hypothetical protein
MCLEENLSTCHILRCFRSFGSDGLHAAAKIGEDGECRGVVNAAFGHRRSLGVPGHMPVSSERLNVEKA